jgi:hypothetical protein
VLSPAQQHSRVEKSRTGWTLVSIDDLLGDRNEMARFLLGQQDPADAATEACIGGTRRRGAVPLCASCARQQRKAQILNQIRKSLPVPVLRAV